MKIRLVSIAFMLPLFVLVALGGKALIVGCTVISVLALYEYLKGFENLEIKASKALATALALVLHAFAFVSLACLDDAELFESFLDMWFFLAVASCFLLIVLDRDHNILGATYTLIGLLYIPFMLLHVAMLESRVHILGWLPCIIGPMADIGGYFGGVYFGKHRLAPTLSPKKTVEGAIGGVIFGTAAAALFSLLFYKEHILFCAVMGVLCSAIAELGDLIASAFKRKMGIKDFSKFIPGHGGVLDRFDSLIFVAPFIYYCTLIFIK